MQPRNFGPKNVTTWKEDDQDHEVPPTDLVVLVEDSWNREERGREMPVAWVTHTEPQWSSTLGYDNLKTFNQLRCKYGKYSYIEDMVE